jgi:hypothetical protein
LLTLTSNLTDVRVSLPPLTKLAVNFFSLVHVIMFSCSKVLMKGNTASSEPSILSNSQTLRIGSVAVPFFFSVMKAMK